MNNKISREQIINENPIIPYLLKIGVEVKNNKCLCPVHKEKSPSCSITDSRLWHCFGCGAGGTVIDLVAQVEQVTIGEAMRRLSSGHKPQMIKRQVEFKTDKIQVPAINFTEMFNKWKANTKPAQIIEFAGKLSLDAMALHLIGCAYSEEGRFWAFPMRNGQGGIIGIRQRFLNGKKSSVTGSKAGLFFDPLLQATTEEFLICEGVSDCAAAMSVGFNAIGRPSCNGQEDMVNDFVKKYRVRKAVIISDNDDMKERPGGNHFYPGQDGAIKLQVMMKIPSVIAVTPGKDLRGMIENGASKPWVKYLYKDKKWYFPTFTTS